MRRIRQPTPGHVVCAVIVALLLYRYAVSTSEEGAGKQRRKKSVTVAWVLDGDTFETEGGERVRLLGMDAPEVAHHDQQEEPYGDESTTWLRQQIGGRTVTLHLGVEETDRYGRTLAWVYTANGTLINQLALSTGQAKLLDRFGLPLDLEPALRKAAATARIQRVGLWATGQRP
jgi:micrococcal nuclease